MVQTIKIVNWAGNSIKVDCDDNLNAFTLFATAPELLCALKLIQANSRLMNALNTAKDRHILDAIQSAIAKATGENNG